MNKTSHTIIFQVNDMHCQSCPKVIKMSLEDIEGVQAVTATLETKTVVVNYNPTQVSMDSLVTAIKDLGYTANPLA